MGPSRQYYVYLLTNKSNSVLYTGVTNDLLRRVHEHKSGMIPGFTAKYCVKQLVYFEVFDDVESAIVRQKQIKSGSRQKKSDLITAHNREWWDPYDEIIGDT